MMWTDAAVWTSLTLATLAGVSAVAWVAAVRRYRLTDAPPGVDPENGREGREGREGGERGERGVGLPAGGSLAAVAAGAAGVFVVRWLVINSFTRPIEAHVDGLALLAALLAVTILAATRRGRLAGLAAFALPLLTLVLLWGVCAALWTYRPFTTPTDHPAAGMLHIVAVYVCGIAGLIAAASAAMYLVLQRRLKHKRHMGGMGRLASLEALERVTLGAGAVALAVLTLGVVGGLIEAGGEGGVWDALWNSKVAAGLGAWVLYGLAVLAGVRGWWGGRWRGVPAAWVTIAATVVLAVGYGVAAGGQRDYAPELDLQSGTSRGTAASLASRAAPGSAAPAEPGAALADSPCPGLQRSQGGVRCES